MPTGPWITINCANGETTLDYVTPVLEEFSSRPSDIHPTLITLIGRNKKAHMLDLLLDQSKEPGIIRSHGQVRLVHDPKISRPAAPAFLVDFELHNYTNASPSVPQWDGQSHASSRRITWLDPGQDRVREFSIDLLSHAIAPFSSVLCYFAGDLQGLSGTAALLAKQFSRPKAHNLPPTALPYILIVIETTSALFDSQILQKKLQGLIDQAMDEHSSAATWHSGYRDIHIIGLQKSWDRQTRAAMFRRRLNSLISDVHWGRRTGQYLFNIRHVDALLDQAIARLCLRPSLFNFLRASRPRHFDASELQVHVTELLRLLPSQSWLWSFAIPLLSSALVMASYPPGSHYFSPAALFDEFYARKCARAIKNYSTDLEVQDKFNKDLLHDMEHLFSELQDGRNQQSVLAMHMERLQSLWPHFSSFKSFKSCMCCLMRMPEKVFDCGHGICNVCVRRFGDGTRSERHAFVLPSCVLCGHVHSESVFRLTPPTAGIRILCIDGGGVRGVIPLVFLQYLDRDLCQLGCPLREYFDYVCGTSAGGLIAIGLFLMRWSPDECLSRFEELARKTFTAEHVSNQFSVTQRVQKLLGAYFRDHRYDSSVIEEAFRSAIGMAPKMFNPLHNDTKVAVTTTTARGNIPCVFSNYNGGQRLEESIYHHVRADSHDHDVSICDAAVCTSAAPFFFKPRDVNNLDTFQDGGLQHNNPAFIASWECGFLWPDRCQILEKNNGYVDHMLSLGTGTSTVRKYKVGPHSPVKDRFLKRLAGTFMGYLDGEKQWKTFVKCVPSELRDRYHRWNVYFPGPEPALDEVTAIERLKKDATRFTASTPKTEAMKNSMIASIFYFELDNCSKIYGTYTCIGTIRCRLPLDYKGRKAFYQYLTTNAAYFIIAGRPIACVELIPKGMPAFRRRVEFTVGSINEKLVISIRGITSRVTPISGMPSSLHRFLEAQPLIAPFGTIDHQAEKLLPHTPSQKRKLDDTWL